MDDIRLVYPQMKHKESIERYKNDMRNDAMLHGTSGLEESSSIENWIKKCDDNRKGKNLPEGYVPATTFIAIRKSDRKVVGSIQIRHSLSEHLLKVGGHIGYMTAFDERRKGYCKEMLRQCLPYCKKLGINKVLITCMKSNIGSAKTILANGGVLENEIEYNGEPYQRYWIDLSGSLIGGYGSPFHLIIKL